MKKKILVMLLACIMLITGCTSTNNSYLYLPYSEFNSNTDVSTDSTTQTTNQSDLFASKLCIIPKGTDTGGDTSITPSAALLVNVTDHKSDYAQNIYNKLYPASITKLATTLVALKYGKLDSIVTVSKEAASITESGAKLCGLKEGDKIVLKDLLTALLVYSGNDAGLAIAHHISGSTDKFAKKMTAEVRKLGGVNSNFVNPHGLHNDNHYTSAYDIYLVFNELLKYDEFKAICGVKSYTMNYKNKAGTAVSKTFKATNQFITGASKAPAGITVVGGKTGTTNKAGSCLALYLKDSSGKEYISVMLNSKSSTALYDQMTKLISKCE